MKAITMTFNTVDQHGSVNGAVDVSFAVDHPANPLTIAYGVSIHGGPAPAAFSLTRSDSQILFQGLSDFLGSNPGS